MPDEVKREATRLRAARRYRARQRETRQDRIERASERAHVEPSKLCKDERVTIYEDPYTRQRPEGTARLVKRQYADEETERWTVDFGDGMKVTRTIVKTGA